MSCCSKCKCHFPQHLAGQKREMLLPASVVEPMNFGLPTFTKDGKNKFGFPPLIALTVGFRTTEAFTGIIQLEAELEFVTGETTQVVIFDVSARGQTLTVPAGHGLVLRVRSAVDVAGAPISTFNVPVIISAQIGESHAAGSGTQKTELDALPWVGAVPRRIPAFAVSVQPMSDSAAALIGTVLEFMDSPGGAVLVRVPADSPEPIPVPAGAEFYRWAALPLPAAQNARTIWRLHL